MLEKHKKNQIKKKSNVLGNENTKKQNEMELEPDLCEKIDPVPILNQSWNQTLSSVPGFF